VDGLRRSHCDLNQTGALTVVDLGRPDQSFRIWVNVKHAILRCDVARGEYSTAAVSGLIGTIYRYRCQPPLKVSGGNRITLLSIKHAQK
jgi:hypothetical protein